ncbi:hypothetical protein [uncultured Mediterranean phage]|nr:hypothetical protein [uncultured Mediterranean phage]
MHFNPGGDLRGGAARHPCVHALGLGINGIDARIYERRAAARPAIAVGRGGVELHGHRSQVLVVKPSGGDVIECHNRHIDFGTRDERLALFIAEHLHAFTHGSRAKGSVHRSRSVAA